MTREFILMPEFYRQWQKLGLGDNELRKLQETLLYNSKAGDIIQGTRGLRNIRITFEGKGKSSRVAYLDFSVNEEIYLITAFSKNEKDDFSEEVRNAIAKMTVRLKHNLKIHRAQNERV